jgi:hypothetical protein
MIKDTITMTVIKGQICQSSQESFLRTWQSQSKEMIYKIQATKGTNDATLFL